MAKSEPINLFENTYRMGSLVFGGGQVLMPMMYEQFCVRPDAVKMKDSSVVRIDKDDMYTGMGIVRALPGPVFSIASFTGGMALKDHGKTLEERTFMQLVGCIIGTVAIFLPSALLVLFFFPIWNNLKKYAAVYRSLEGINAVVVGIMIASTFYLMKDISLIGCQAWKFNQCNCYCGNIYFIAVYKNTTSIYRNCLPISWLYFLIFLFIKFSCFNFFSYNFGNQVANRFPYFI